MIEKLSNIYREFSKLKVQIIAIIIASLGIIPDGMQYGWISPATSKITSPNATFQVTEKEAQWAGHFYLMGNFCGVLISMFIFTGLSRRSRIFIAIIPVFIGWIGVLTARNVYLLYFVRLIGGIGRNMLYVTIPTYMGEVASPRMRGLFSSLIYFYENTGLLLSFMIIPYYAIEVIAWVGIVISALSLVLIWCIPESPYYLLEQSKPNEALMQIRRLSVGGKQAADFERIKNAVDHSKRVNAFESLSLLFSSKVYLKGLSILVLLRYSQVFSGITVMNMNVHTIFQKVKGKLDRNTSSIVFIGMNLAICILCMLFVDAFRRRVLVMTSCLVCCLCLTLTGTYFLMDAYDVLDLSDFTWLPVLFIVIYLLGYRLGLGTVPIAMIGILLPSNVKMAGATMVDLTYSASTLVANFLFHLLKDNVGNWAPFFLYSGFCILNCILSYAFVPETLGKTMEEVQAMLANKQVPSAKI